MKTKQQKYFTAFKVLLPFGIVFLVLMVFTLIFAISSGVDLSRIGQDTIAYSSSTGGAEQVIGDTTANFFVALLGSIALVLFIILTVINAVIGGVCLTLALVFRKKGKTPANPASSQN